MWPNKSRKKVSFNELTDCKGFKSVVSSIALMKQHGRKINTSLV